MQDWGFITSIRHLLLSDYFFCQLFNENRVNQQLNANLYPNPNPYP